MNEKIINVFFGVDCLPYKDAERQVHYPILGGAFLGASNTTKIRFYYDRIGDSNTTWVSVAKLPNGKQGSQVLSKSSDSDGNYAELELNSWYTQAKGDVYIALQGYQGGVEYSYDSSTELYEIHGTPTIQTTGSIKLAINYAPIGDSPDYNDEFTTYQEILAALGDKADADNVYSKAETDSALDTKVDKLDSTGTYAYTHNGSTQGQTVFHSNVVSNGIVQRDSNGEINVPTTPSGNDKATSKSYVDTGLATKQNTLVNQINIKSVNNQSLLGTGNIEIETGGGAWGEITGDITDQADLQAEFQNIREVAEGKCQSIVISYAASTPISDGHAQTYSKPDGTHFTSLSDFNTYVSGLSLGNGSFYLQDAIILLSSSYIISNDRIVYTGTYIIDNFKIGDIILVSETNVPDRWYAGGSAGVAGFYKLETSKVDLSGYATQTDVVFLRKNIASDYSSSNTYTVGEVVLYNYDLYRCTTAITTAEPWNPSHWEVISVASGFVNLTGTQTISGAKTFSSVIASSVSTANTSAFTCGTLRIATDGNSNQAIGENNNEFKFYSNNIRVNSPTFRPQTNNTTDLGASGIAFKDLYLSGTAWVSTINSASHITIGNGSYYLYIAADSLRPTNNGVKDIGSTNANWRNIFVKTIKGITTMTQAEYDALVSGGNVDSNTLYFIEE